MIPAARLLMLLATVCFVGACGQMTPSIPTSHSVVATPPPTGDVLQASPYRLVGRILAIDAPRGFAFIDLTAGPPVTALTEGAELIARTDDLRETARLRASRFVRDRTFGTTILTGRPAPGDEVVIHVP